MHSDAKDQLAACQERLAALATKETALQESELRYRFLDQVGQATRALTGAGDVMAVTARLLGEYLGATRCAYADVEADNDRFTIRSDWTMPGVASSAGVYSLDLFGHQAADRLRRGEHLVVRDVDREIGDEDGGRMFKAIGIKAIICAGLVKDHRLVAMMAVHQSTPRDWTQQEVALVGEVVERSWAHIERVRDAEMLRDQDRRKDEFLATLAHELRNPLAPVKYAVALMRRLHDPVRLRQAQDVVDRQISHMSRLIDDLLDLSRISRGLVHLQLERTALAGVMRQALEAARPALEEGRHQVQVLWPDDGVLVDADATRLVQVIGNLLSNAAKYTPDGGHVRLAGSRSGNEAVVEVSDDGIGIPPEQQGRLFQMFTQLDHSTTRAKGGLGIGLALVKTLVEMHGGSVALSSAGLHQGSTFTIRLPLPADVAAAPPQPAAGQEDAEPSSVRVLVVEDNPDGRETLISLLEMVGYAVEGAGDGGAALEAAHRFRPHIVLLDIGLPVMDGYEVCRRLRADASLAGAKLVALTGWGTEADRQRTLQAGFDLHLTKPVEPDALLECVQQLGGVRAREPY
jgi:signal transduction histidine kinase/CheY-like chemotaxis protein